MSPSPDIGRPAIPSELRRRVLVEAGHRCAIPTCRYIEVDVHHIVPWAERQAHHYDNLIALCPNCHRRADRGEIDRKSLRLYKVNLRFVHDKYSQLEIDVLFDLNRHPPGIEAQWPHFMRILLKRIIDAGLLHLREPSAFVRVDGLRMSPDMISLTDKGRRFLADLGVAEL